MSKFDGFVESIGKTIEDFSQLNVRTFSGDLTTTINGVADDLSDLDTLLKKGVTAGTISIQASSTLKIDGDIDQIYDTNITSEMQEIHDKAVTTGKESRKAIVDFLKELA
jgi:hypothetical protein